MQVFDQRRYGVPGRDRDQHIVQRSKQTGALPTVAGARGHRLVGSDRQFGPQPRDLWEYESRLHSQHVGEHRAAITSRQGTQGLGNGKQRQGVTQWEALAAQDDDTAVFAASGSPR